MEKKFTILVALVFIISAMAPFIMGYQQAYSEENKITDAPGMDELRGGYTGPGDFCWTHEIELGNKYILGAELTIRAYDIDYYDPYWEIVKIHVDGTYIGDLENTGNDAYGETTFTIDDLSIFDDGEVEVCVEFDDREDYLAEIDWSKLTVEYTHVIVEKYNHGEEFVEVETIVYFPLEICVENPDTESDDDLEYVNVLDGIGAEFDLVVYNNGGSLDEDQIPDSDDYIFKIGGIPVTPVNGDVDSGFSGDIYWCQANQGKGAGKNKGCATKILWEIGTLAEDSSVCLTFTIVTKSWTVGNSNNVKQSFTSTCWHTLNDGPWVYYDIGDDHYKIQGDPVEVFVCDEDPETADTDDDGWLDVLEVNIYGTDPCDPEDYPESFRLIEKNPDTWDPVHDPVTDGPYGILTYNPSGPTFDFDFEGWNLESEEDYALIYYADPWPGNNPGAFLGEDTTDGSGYIHITGGMGGIELNMDLPHPNDGNYPAGFPPVAGEGAKIWLVLTDDYDDGTNAMTGWNPTEYLFEEETWDRVFYDDTDV
jgi:hypothetical protein